MAVALAASSLFSVGLAHATVEAEPNDSAPGNSGVVGQTFFGGVTNFNDPYDFVTFNPLTFGATYTLRLVTSPDIDDAIFFDLYKNGAATSFDGESLLSGTTKDLGPFSDFTALTIRVSTNNTHNASEGYSVRLDKTADAPVPEPASAALLAAGLAAAFVARRRKRS